MEWFSVFRLPQIVRGQKPGIARFRAFFVEVTRGAGNQQKVFLGRHERVQVLRRWCRGEKRLRTVSRIGTGGCSPGVFYSKTQAQHSIRNTLGATRRGAKLHFRIIPVVVEIKLRERAPVGYILEPVVARNFRELRSRPVRRGRARRRRDIE